LVVFAEFWGASPEVGGALVEGDNDRVRVADINGGWKCLDEIPGKPIQSLWGVRH
jgi:hypothetical protein